MARPAPKSACWWATLLGQYARFCAVGTSGLAVDMSVLWLLASGFGWNLSLSKAVAAEAAICNNFLWNELWTFRGLTAGRRPPLARLRRLGRFNAVCLAGVGLSVLLLNAQVRGLGMNPTFSCRDDAPAAPPRAGSRGAGWRGCSSRLVPEPCKGSGPDHPGLRTAATFSRLLGGETGYPG